MQEIEELNKELIKIRQEELRLLRKALEPSAMVCESVIHLPVLEKRQRVSF
ncbi:hypothetical protein KAU88_09905 [Candidatus Bathyarchaeota archaeon]|nr:hypothetical protein [Candidatus Bathyarchaeota archaeon]